MIILYIHIYIYMYIYLFTMYVSILYEHIQFHAISSPKTTWFLMIQRHRKTPGRAQGWLNGKGELCFRGNLCCRSAEVQIQGGSAGRRSAYGGVLMGDGRCWGGRNCFVW